MSFLARSNLNLSETNANLISRLDDKSKRLSASQSNTNIINSLDNFRQDLRRQLTDKLKTSTTIKVGPTSSPSKRTHDYREIFEANLGNKRSRSPTKNNPLYISNPITSLSRSQKNFNFASDITRRIDERSPKKPSQDSIALSSLEKKVSGKNSQTSIDFRSSFSTKDRSPTKQSFSKLETKTPDYKKGSRQKPSFLTEGLSMYTPQGARSGLIKILDATHTPQRAHASETKNDLGRPQSALAHAFNNLRSSRIALHTHSPERSETINLTPTKNSNDGIRNLSNFVSDSFKGRTRQRNGDIKSYSTQNLTTSGRIYGQERSTIVDRLPLSKVYEIQDIFDLATDKDFDGLPSDYVEELIKLSSSIMHRVKNSAYYTQE